MEEMLKVMNQVVTFSMSLFTTITGNAILSFILLDLWLELVSTFSDCSKERHANQF